MKADNGHTMPMLNTSRPVKAGPSLQSGYPARRSNSGSIPEPSAAYVARQECRRIVDGLDAMRARQPIAARVCEALLLRELAKDLAPVLLELMADAAGEPERVPAA